MGECPSGLSWGDVVEEHSSHSAVVHCSQGTGEHHLLKIAVEVLGEEGNLHHSQAVWGTGGNHQLRIALEVLEEDGSLQCQLDCGKGMSYPH